MHTISLHIATRGEAWDMFLFLLLKLCTFYKLMCVVMAQILFGTNVYMMYIPLKTSNNTNKYCFILIKNNSIKITKNLTSVL